MNAININGKFGEFTKYFTPHIVAECNGQHIKLTKLKGEFVWHLHENEDEVFIVYKGMMIIDFRDKSVELSEGEMLVVPKGVEHRPRAGENEAWVMLIEPKTTYHTGNVKNEMTVENQEWI